MIKRLASSAALLLLACATHASAASIKIDLNNFVYGDGIGDYYNGGHDSLNRKGQDVGLSFSNAYVKYRPRGAYLAGPAVLTIDQAKLRAALGTDRFYISFRGGRYLPGADESGPVWVLFDDGHSEPYTYLGHNWNPYCASDPAFCNWPHYASMYGRAVGTYDGVALPARIHFGTDRLDSIEIVGYVPGQGFNHPDSFGGSDALDRDIPEPASIPLIGAAGALALLFRRRRNKAGAR